MAAVTYVQAVGKKRHIAVGLEWVSPPGLRVLSRERRTIARSRHASHTVELRPQNTRPLIGVAFGLARSVKAVSAAALLSTHVPTGAAAFIWAIEGNAAFVAVRDGAPLVGFDLVVSHEGARAKLAELAELVGGFGSFRVFANFPVGVEAEALPLHELFREAEAWPKAGRLQPATLPTRAILGSIAVIGMAFAAVRGFELYQAHLAEKARAAQRAPEQVDPNVAYRAAVPAALAAAGLRADHIDSMLEPARKIPLTNAGWWMERVTCQPTICSTTWTINGGTFDTFSKSPLPDLQNIQMQGDFKTILADVPVHIGSGTGLQEAELLSAEELRLRVGSMIQLLSGSGIDQIKTLGLNLTLNEPAVLALPPGVAESQLRHPVRVGSWTMQGKLFMATFPASFPPGFSVTSLTATVPKNQAEDATITIAGNYYVKG
ncbi:type 4b pilus protein PilO2 [Paracidovorax citrulli]